MTILPKIIESLPSLRWKASEFVGSQIYSRAFGSWGNRSVIVSPLRLKGIERIFVGTGVAVYEGAWLATEGTGELHIGNDVYIGHRVHLHALDPITIGDGCVLADNVMVNSGDHNKNDIHRVSGRGAIHIGNNVFLGQNVVVLGGITIGDGAIIGANAVVTRDVPAGSVVAGVPAKNLTKNS